MAVVAESGDGPGRLLAPATIDRILAAVSSFYDWAIVAEEYDHGVSPVQMREDPALARVPERHQPFMGRASRQRPTRRVVQVKRPRRLPRPMDDQDVEALPAGVKRLRDLATLLLMLDGRRRGWCRGFVMRRRRALAWHAR
jgi:integrase